MRKTMGPAAMKTPDGGFTLHCVTSRTACTYVSPSGICRQHSRMIPDVAETPSWCNLAGQIRQDMQDMADFQRLGLTYMERPELMKLMKDVPAKYRRHWDGKPFKLTEHNAEMMRVAIRDFWDAEGKTK